MLVVTNRAVDLEEMVFRRDLTRVAMALAAAGVLLSALPAGGGLRGGPGCSWWRRTVSFKNGDPVIAKKEKCGLRQKASLAVANTTLGAKKSSAGIPAFVEKAKRRSGHQPQ
ncbi:hypothetical protein ACH4SP_11450 [Streptomyces sp. NPDC021093]|uniref:hypothetical protein n=1 Tax=Streptomyces sp. NPDC021093 TaxID=3365112 RepID=UPI00379A7214